MNNPIDYDLLHDEVFGLDYAKECVLIANNEKASWPKSLNDLIPCKNAPRLLQKWICADWVQKREIIFLNASSSFLAQGRRKPCTQAIQTIRLYKKWAKTYGDRMAWIMFRRKLGVKLPVEVVIENEYEKSKRISDRKNKWTTQLQKTAIIK
jgi:hypothetical protein